jgi:hypothetical protein
MRYRLGFDNMTYAPGTSGTIEGATRIEVSASSSTADILPVTAPGIIDTPAAVNKEAETKFPLWLLIGAVAAWYI